MHGLTWKACFGRADLNQCVSFYNTDIDIQDGLTLAVLSGVANFDACCAACYAYVPTTTGSYAGFPCRVRTSNHVCTIL